jgi:proline iminopeptidase
MSRWGCLLVLAALPGLGQTGTSVSGMVHTADVDLAYEVYGAASTATPVIAVNGGPGLSHKYMLQNDVWTRRIAAGRQVVFYDQRGTGKSQRLVEGAPQTMAAQVGDLDAVRAKLGFEKVDLAGDSYGGLLAMAYVASHPEHVRRLILSDSAPPAWKDMVHLLPDVFPDIEEQDAEIGKKQTDPDKAAQEQLINHFRMIFYSEDLLHKYLDGIGDLGSTPKVGDAVFKAIADIDLTAELPKIKAPTLVITGRYDMNVAPLTAWRMYKTIPGAKIEIFAKSGHLPYYEEPEKYAKVVSAFLDGQ